MRIIKGTLDFQFDKETALSIGKFDGIHLGHKLILDKLWDYHENSNYHTAIITFDVAPLNALKGEKTQLLTTLQEKELVMEASGIDTIVVLPFTPEVSRITAEDFIKDILVKKMNMKAIVMGEDCTFGYEARGNVNMLEEKAAEYGYTTTVFPRKTYNGKIISSTYIREILKEGKVGEVRAMSRQPYFIYGNVVEGGLRQKFGYPLCVMRVPEDKVVPASGLYYSKIMKDDVFYPSLSFVSQENRYIESYLFSADKNLGYDDISVGLFEYVRESLTPPDAVHLTEPKFRDQFKTEIVEAFKWHRENIYTPEDVC